MENEMVFTDRLIFGQKIFIESTRQADVDLALKVLFKKRYEQAITLPMDTAEAKTIKDWADKK